MSQLYLGNLAPEVDEPLLFELMLQLSPVASVQMPKSKVTRKHQGYGFATFAAESDADYVFKILKDTHLKLFGRSLKVNRAQRAQTTAESVVPQRIFVGNLDPELVSEEALALPFGRFGRVLKVEVVRDASGTPKGYGYVTLSSVIAAHEAVASINGQYLMNRVCKVEFERS